MNKITRLSILKDMQDTINWVVLSTSKYAEMNEELKKQYAEALEKAKIIDEMVKDEEAKK